MVRVGPGIVSLRIRGGRGGLFRANQPRKGCSVQASVSTCLAPNQGLKAKRAASEPQQFTGGLLGYAGQAPGGGGAVARFVAVARPRVFARTPRTRVDARSMSKQKKCKKGDA